MKARHLSWARLGAMAAGLLLTVAALLRPAHAQAPAAKPNILFIMGDDIGWMQPSIYHRGLMVGETPNIDRIGNEGALFTDYYAEQSCTSGRNAFFTGMHPLRTGMIPPQLPGGPSYLRPGTPALAWFLRDLGYNTGEFGKNHLGDHAAALPTAHGFQEFWGIPVPPGRDAGGKLPRPKQEPARAGHCAALQEHAGSRPPRGPRRCGSQDNGLPDASPPGARVHVVRWDGGEPDLQGRGSADAGALENGG
jgi:sulfatase-like protein